LKIEALTLYAFSVENWRRPKTEIDFLMALLREYLRKEMPLIQKNNIGCDSSPDGRTPHWSAERCAGRHGENSREPGHGAVRGAGIMAGERRSLMP